MSFSAAQVALACPWKNLATLISLVFVFKNQNMWRLYNSPPKTNISTEEMDGWFGSDVFPSSPFLGEEFDRFQGCIAVKQKKLSGLDKPPMDQLPQPAFWLMKNFQLTEPIDEQASSPRISGT